MNEPTIRGAKAQQNLQKWSQRVAECRNSGVSVSRWCTEHEINPKTYYNWQRKVFIAMMEQQETPIVQPEEPERRFAELPAPQTGHNLAAAVRFDRATLEVYSGASVEVAVALCKVLNHAQ